MFNSIHHIALICSHYEISKKFYTHVLNFKILHEVYRAERKSYKLDLQVDEHTQIELFSFENPPKRPSFPEACGLRHLAFRVDNIDAAIAHLKTHQVICEPIRMDEYTGKSFTFFKDPDGLPLELYET